MQTSQPPWCIGEYRRSRTRSGPDVMGMEFPPLKDVCHDELETSTTGR